VGGICMNLKNACVYLMSAWMFLVASTVDAGVYKLATPDKSGMKLYWWPILPDLPGWVHDQVASKQYDSNFLVPRGQTFANAPAVIYARALYKPKIPDTKSIDQLIADDERQVGQDSPGIRMSEQAALQDRDGKGFRCVSFAPSAEGNWEFVAYGDEDDFYLIFTLSGKSPVALEKALPDFKQLIARYKKKL
jgi:hypothetical protein